MSNFQTLQAVSAMSAASTAETTGEVNKESVRRADTQRKDLQLKIREKEAEAAKLQKDLEEASDMDGWDHFCNFFTGGDNGVGELSDDIAQNAAEMEKASHELALAQAEIDKLLQELQVAQGELGQRTNNRQRNYDEADKAQRTALD